MTTDNGHDGISAYDELCEWCHAWARTVTVDNHDPRLDQSAHLELCALCAQQAMDESERYFLRDASTYREVFIDSYFRTMGAGLIFDGQHGQTYNDARLCQLAARMGWDAPAMEPVDAEECEWDTREALDFINERGYVYGWRLDWEDGDLMAARIYETLHVCQCCLSLLANGDDSSCRDYYGHEDGTDDHPLPPCEFRYYPERDGWRITPGIMPAEHAEGYTARDGDLYGSEGCGCDVADNSPADCDGCGQRSEGYAARSLVTATKYAPGRA